MDGKKVIVVVIFLFFSVNIAKAEDFTGKKVTVPKFTPSGKKAQKEKWLKVGLADMILNDIAATGKLEVVPRRALEKIMEEQKIQQSGAINKKTAVKIGKMVGADLLVSGNYQLIENYIRINTTVYDVEKGVSVGAANVSGNVNEVFKLEKLLVTKLLKNLDLSLSQEEKINFFRTSSQNLKALEKNYKGELAREKGNKKQPEELFQEARKIDPGFEEARKNLEAVKKVDSQNLSQVVEKKLEKDLNNQKTEAQHTKILRQLGRYAAKNLWNYEIDSLDKEDITKTYANGRVDLSASLKVSWNYQAVQKIYRKLKKIDADEQGEIFVPLTFKIRDDASSPKTVRFNTYKTSFEEWNKYGDEAYFHTRAKIKAISNNGNVLAESPYIAWQVNADGGENGERIENDSRDYSQPFGTNKVWKIYDIDYLDSYRKSEGSVINSDSKHNRYLPERAYEIELGGFGPINYIDDFKYSKITPTAYYITTILKGIHKNKIKNLSHLELTEPEVYVDVKSGRGANKKWIKYKNLK